MIKVGWETYIKEILLIFDIKYDIIADFLPNNVDKEFK